MYNIIKTTYTFMRAVWIDTSHVSQNAHKFYLENLKNFVTFAAWKQNL